MISKGLGAFNGKRILLLQGPMGPFFRRLARDLEWTGAKVCKVNFNGGDWLFYPAGAINFRGTLADWAIFFEQLLIEKQIDIVLLFGDCRPVHKVAHEISVQHGVDVGVFEEGYLRPHHISFERFGANAFSRLPRNPIFYLNTTVRNLKPIYPLGNTYWYGVLWAIMYYVASSLLRWFLPVANHHRPLKLTEALPWLLSLWRKGYYAIKERRLQDKLCGPLAGRYFLVPLQTHNDAQICFHSRYRSIGDFIYDVMQSFAANAPAWSSLVIKHHPLDRGYHDYTRLIRSLAEAFKIQGRVYYLHDQHLPTLLGKSRGVIVVNSTVGLSALRYGVPVKVCGDAIYDMQGLTCQLPLHRFWRIAQASKPSRKIYESFCDYLMTSCQINGSFYKRLKIPGSSAGLNWPAADSPETVGVPVSLPKAS